MLDYNRISDGRKPDVLFIIKDASFSGMDGAVLTDSQMVARRLRAVMADLELDTVAQLAKFIDAKHSQVSNWLQGYNLPPTRWMGILCRRRPGLTLDWIYRGVGDAVPHALLIKLEALVQGIEVPLLDKPESQEPGARGGYSAASRSAAQMVKGRKRAI